MVLFCHTKEFAVYRFVNPNDIACQSMCHVTNQPQHEDIKIRVDREGQPLFNLFVIVMSCHRYYSDQDFHIRNSIKQTILLVNVPCPDSCYVCQRFWVTGACIGMLLEFIYQFR